MLRRTTALAVRPVQRHALDGKTIASASYQVFLGLKEDVERTPGITESVIFLETCFDPYASYAGALRGDVESGGVRITLYDTDNPEYSTKGKNPIDLMILQNFCPWEKKAVCLGGDNKAYRRKERMADALIAKEEKPLLPGLANAIQVKRIGTPLTDRVALGRQCPAGLTQG